MLHEPHKLRLWCGIRVGVELPRGESCVRCAVLGKGTVPPIAGTTSSWHGLRMGTVPSPDIANSRPPMDVDSSSLGMSLLLQCSRSAARSGWQEDPRDPRLCQAVTHSQSDLDAVPVGRSAERGMLGWCAVEQRCESITVSVFQSVATLIRAQAHKSHVIPLAIRVDEEAPPATRLPLRRDLPRAVTHRTG
jgi:hypothetical protein